MIKETELKMLFDSETIQKKVAKLGEQLNNEYGDEILYLICVLKGSVMFLVDLSKHLKMPLRMEFIKMC